MRRTRTHHSTATQEKDNQMKTTTLCGSAFFALVAIAGLSPSVEMAQDTIVYDAVVTRTCLSRHGFDFLSRWSCRSSLRQLGPMALGMGCAFNKDKKSDVCETFDKINTENKAP
jgi:hypothetical protein